MTVDDLAARARETRVVVVGGGLAGLAAAWQCAKVGMAVFASNDAKEGPRAFAEKRAPVWRAR